MTDNESTRKFIENVRFELTTEVLSPSIAKLYSQYTRLKMKQPGLIGWRENEFSDRIADAITLIDAGLSERELNGPEWRQTLKRAAEILEWISLPTLNVKGLPLRLLAAGIYQLAGYPALALGLLNDQHSDTTNTTDSKVLTALLKGDFPEIFTLIIQYWGIELPNKKMDNNVMGDNNIPDLNNRIINEIIKSIGILATYMRWEEDTRLDIAKKKLRDTSNIMIYGTDSYSWLLSKIVTEVVDEYVSNSMRSYISSLQNSVSEFGRTAFEKYLRSNYKSRKSLVWYSQVKGISKLLEEESFALCTPTGSGKTTIAELAIIQSMFKKENSISLSEGPIVIYLVPSRALASEVEMKMLNVLGKLGSHSVKVTGLYGGIDWGPTDAWVTTSDPTVLICTYEKGEALIRFLGPLFLNRVSLIIIDEAHSVQFNGLNYDDLRSADNRGLRLEMLVTRLLQYSGEKRMIALSAVADDNESLACWISGNENASPVISSHRSTRQLIGRLEWSRLGKYEIFYDTLNDQDLIFAEDSNKKTAPYIQNPFQKFPIEYNKIPKMFINEKKGVSKRQRPHLFWAAMQLAQPDEQGLQHSVLISITQHVGGYAEDFLYVLTKTFSKVELPEFFKSPSNLEQLRLFEKCLEVCKDYFGADSNEYLLLKRGIAVHHGNMPGLLSRLLVELIQKRIIHITIATSTLSEGVNLPFETVIIPTLLRNGESINISEFKNLAGRAGRPGSGTEGRTLVFLESKQPDYSSEFAYQNYSRLIEDIKKKNREKNTKLLSPLGTLITYIYQEWTKISNSKSNQEFMKWLEKTIPLETVTEEKEVFAEEALDSLDGYLLTILVEQELISDYQKNQKELEQFLIEVWNKTYASYVVNTNTAFEKVFLTRGLAIQETIYPNSKIRRRLYKTSVSPRFGKEILASYESICNHLKTGLEYPNWSATEQLQYISKAVGLVGDIEKFKFPKDFGKGKNKTTWEEILTWWMIHIKASKSPNNKQVSEWIKFIKKHFDYKFNWGLGTIISLILDDINDGALRETKIEEWPKTGLPWIVFWLKELINWGTLDPVAALLLANSVENTRLDAENKAKEYYLNCEGIPIDEILNPISIKKWVNTFLEKKATTKSDDFKEINVCLSRDFTKKTISEWRVLPIVLENSLSWIDPAGYELATSKLPNLWEEDMESKFDFVLNTNLKRIRISRYI